MYSAPGYMDCTDWCLGDTEEEAVKECKELYGSDDDEEEEEEEDLDGENADVCWDCGSYCNPDTGRCDSCEFDRGEA